MEFKEEYQKLLNIIKSTPDKDGKFLRNEDIAKQLGYNRSYFSQLVGYKGKVTADHIRLLKLQFGSMLGNITPPADIQKPEKIDYKEKYYALLEKRENEISLNSVIDEIRAERGLLREIYIHLTAPAQKKDVLEEPGEPGGKGTSKDGSLPRTSKKRNRGDGSK